MFILIRFICGHLYRLASFQWLNPQPGDVLYCPECMRDQRIESVTETQEAQ